jgi:hypothetical protein
MNVGSGIEIRGTSWSGIDPINVLMTITVDIRIKLSSWVQSVGLAREWKPGTRQLISRNSSLSMR